MGVRDSLKHAFSVFSNSGDEPSDYGYGHLFNAEAIGTNTNPARTRMNVSNERSIIASIYTRLAIDFASIAIRHIKVDENDRYTQDVKSGLNSCLSLEANLDQAGRAFRQDVAMTLFEKGVIAILPIDTSLNPAVSGSYDVMSMRVGHIVKWYPKRVRVSVYNEETGKRQEITVDKKICAIVENPFYSVMNEPNSTLRRLIRKLNLLDAIDEQAGSGKLDLIIQLPYVIKSETRRQQAIKRKEELEYQLAGSKYGIAYTDGTEKITQLNRPAENNLLAQITYLVEKLYSELGLTPEVMNGTADEKTMLNYLNRTIEPVLDAVVEEMRRKFLTKTARTQGHTLAYYRDAFKLVPLSEIAELADKLLRNEVVSSNEIRSPLGFKPSSDPKADELRNSNMPAPSESATSIDPQKEGDSQNGT